MRLPRWLQLGMLAIAVLLALASLTWWWIQWPRRTLHEFTALVGQGQFDEASRIMGPPSRWLAASAGGEFVTLKDERNPNSSITFAPVTWNEYCGENNVQYEPRTVWDVLRGRQPFYFGREGVPPFFIGGYSQHGRVFLRCEPWAAVP